MSSSLQRLSLGPLLISLFRSVGLFFATSICLHHRPQQSVKSRTFSIYVEFKGRQRTAQLYRANVIVILEQTNGDDSPRVKQNGEENEMEDEVKGTDES